MAIGEDRVCSLLVGHYLTTAMFDLHFVSGDSAVARGHARDLDRALGTAFSRGTSGPLIPPYAVGRGSMHPSVYVLPLG